MVYLPDRIERWQANTPGAATAGFDLIETLDNPLNVVPVVQLETLVGYLSVDAEVDDLMRVVNGLNKLRWTSWCRRSTDARAAGRNRSDRRPSWTTT
jgi:hypothetical protein